MARKAILETGYTFTPGASGVGSVVIPRAVQRERLILITNVTTNTVIYNFSDQNLKATSYTVSTTGGTNTTTVVLNCNTTGMLSTDKLQIIVDEYDEKFTPSETYTDPIPGGTVPETITVTVLELVGISIVPIPVTPTEEGKAKGRLLIVTRFSHLEI